MITTKVALTDAGERLLARHEQARRNLLARPGQQLSLLGIDGHLRSLLDACRVQAEQSREGECVYAIRAAERVKIGYCGGRGLNLRWRITDIRNKAVRFYGWERDQISLVALWSGSRELERTLHSALRAFQVVPDDLPYPCEWFNALVLPILGVGCDA